MGRGFCDDRQNAAPDCVRPALTAGLRLMSSQMAISGEPALECRPSSLFVSDGRGVSSDRQPAILGGSKGAAVASGVRCRAYGVRTAA